MKMKGAFAALQPAATQMRYVAMQLHIISEQIYFTQSKDYTASYFFGIWGKKKISCIR